MSMVAVVLVAEVSLNFPQLIEKGKEIVQETKEKVCEWVCRPQPIVGTQWACERVLVCPPSINRYKEFLTNLEETDWQHPDADKLGNCPVSGTSTDSSPPTIAECELRTLKNEYEMVGTINNLQNAQLKGDLSVSLMFVPSNDHHWLKKEFTNFEDNSNLNDIVKKRDMLRTLFEAFVASNVLENPFRLNSSEYPYLALTCRIAENLTFQTLQLEWKTLPFFSNNDVLRVKSLSKVVDEAQEAELIPRSDNDATVLYNLCQLAKEQESIQAGVDYEMKEANLEDAEIKKMTEAAEAVLKFIDKIKTVADCP